MAFPVSTTDNNLTGTFGERKPLDLTNGLKSGGFHYGMDFAPEVRGAFNRVYAVKAGTVTGVGHRKDAGRFIIIYVPEWRVWVRYCHLSSYAVSFGQKVSEALAIGHMGATGNVTGVHLHFEIYTDSGLTNRVDPKPYIWGERNPRDFAINGGGEKASAPTADAPASSAPAPAKPADPQTFTFSTGGYMPWIEQDGSHFYLLNNGGKRVHIQDTADLAQLRAGLRVWSSARAAGRSSYTLGKYNGRTMGEYLEKIRRAGRAKINLGTSWKRYTTPALTVPYKLNFPAGEYRVLEFNWNGSIRLQHGDYDGWVHASARDGLT